MKLCLYTSTPGLERFPKLERFRVWESTHKQLVREDPEYRRHVSRSRWTYIWVTIVFTIAIVYLSLEMNASAARGRTAISLNLICLGVTLVGFIVYSVMASSRFQQFMNRKVARALQ
jgi:hypothetical protein